MALQNGVTSFTVFSRERDSTYTPTISTNTCANIFLSMDSLCSNFSCVMSVPGFFLSSFS